MTHGGTLRLAARAASRRRVEIVVEDTGSGIKPTEMPRIFDLYFTTKNGGSGIGLSMIMPHRADARRGHRSAVHRRHGDDVQDSAAADVNLLSRDQGRNRAGLSTSVDAKSRLPSLRA
jgi:hypothetical protein